MSNQAVNNFRVGTVDSWQSEMDDTLVDELNSYTPQIVKDQFFV